MYRLQINSPTVLFSQLLAIAKSGDSKKVILEIVRNTPVYDMRSMNGIIDIIQMFKVSSPIAPEGLNFELHITSDTLWPALAIMAAVGKDKVYSHKRLCIRFADLSDWYHGKVGEMMVKADADSWSNEQVIRLIAETYILDKDLIKDMVDEGEIIADDSLPVYSIEMFEDSPFDMEPMSDSAKLLPQRIVPIDEDVHLGMSERVVAQLRMYDKTGDEPIIMPVCSFGGSTAALQAMYSQIELTKAVVITIGFGICASAGADMLMIGTKGSRYILPRTQVMIHDGGGYGGEKALEYFRVQSRMQLELITDATGQDMEKVKLDLEKDLFLTPAEAVAYGIVDQIIE